MERDLPAAQEPEMPAAPPTDVPLPTRVRCRIGDLVWRRGSPFTVHERAAAEVIARHMNSRGRSWPRHETIAEESGMSRRRLQDAVRVLAEGDEDRGIS